MKKNYFLLKKKIAHPAARAIKTYVSWGKIMADVTPFSLGFRGVRNTDETIRGIIAKVSGASVAGSVATTTVDLPTGFEVAKRSTFAVVVYAVLSVVTFGVFALVENLVHRAHVKKFEKLVETFKLDATNSGDQNSLLTDLGLANFKTQLTTLCEPLTRKAPSPGPGPKPGPAKLPRPGPTINHPPLVITDVDAFQNALKTVGIAAAYGEGTVHTAKIAGENPTEPVAAIMARIRQLIANESTPDFSSIANLDNLNVALGFLHSETADDNYETYALTAVHEGLHQGKLNDFVELLRTYAEKLKTEKIDREKEVRTAAWAAIDGDNKLDPNKAEDYLGKDDIGTAIADGSNLNTKTQALGVATTLFQDFDLGVFATAQVRIVANAASANGFKEDGVVGLTDVTCTAIVSEDDANGKYFLGDLITTIGGANSGIKLVVGKDREVIEAAGAEAFIAVVNDFRTGHAKALAEAEITVSTGSDGSAVAETKAVYALYSETYAVELAKHTTAIDEANAAFETEKKKFLPVPAPTA
jgi:hypothetical protein